MGDRNDWGALLLAGVLIAAVVLAFSFLLRFVLRIG
jgi:hypothetical protein